MVAAVSPMALSAPLPEAVKNVLRARILRSMLLSVAQRASGAAKSGGGNEM